MVCVKQYLHRHLAHGGVLNGYVAFAFRQTRPCYFMILLFLKHPQSHLLSVQRRFLLALARVLQWVSTNGIFEINS